MKSSKNKEILAADNDRGQIPVASVEGNNDTAFVLS